MAIPLICILVEVAALSLDALIDGAGAIAVLSAVESGFGEQAASVMRVMTTVDSFAGRLSLVIIRLVG